MTDLLRKWWVPAWLFALYFVFPIPHTVALRNALLIAGLAGCLWIIHRQRNSQHAWRTLAEFRASGWVLAILTLWLLFQSAVISPYPGLALDHWRHDWLNGLLLVITGICAVLACRDRGVNQPLVAIILALFAHIVLLLAYQTWQWGQTGVYPFGATLFAERDYPSTLATMLTALLLATLLVRTRSAEQGLFPLPVTLIMLAFSLLATTTLLTRNAVIITILLLLASIAIFAVTGVKRFGRKLLPAIIALLVVSSLLSWVALRSDPRWQVFSDAAAVALDTQNNMAWLDEAKYPRPLMKNGQPVDHSAYMRLAWGKVAVEQIQRYPLGLGYGHKAFGWAVNRSYNVDTGHESSHSGWLDFALANGIPGLLLWLALSITLIVSGWRAFRTGHSAIGLLLVFSVIAYLIRCLLDGHLTGFRLDMYALLIGMLVMMQASERKQCS